MITDRLIATYSNKIGESDMSPSKKRCVRFCTAPTFIIAAAIDVIAGVFTVVPAIFNKKAYFFAFNNLESSISALANTVFNVLYVVKPSMEVNFHKKFMSDHIVDYFDNKASLYLNSKNKLVQEVGSRTASFVQLLACIVTRVIEAVICPFALLGMLCTLGRNKEVNSFAFRALQFTGIIHDVFYCAVKIINPRAAGL
jgi:hypothetical protein